MSADTINAVRNAGAKAHAMVEVLYQGKPLRAYLDAETRRWVVVIKPGSTITDETLAHRQGEPEERVRERLVERADAHPEQFKDW
jgi:hypothetical protein